MFLWTRDPQGDLPVQLDLGAQMMSSQLASHSICGLFPPAQLHSQTAPPLWHQPVSHRLKFSRERESLSQSFSDQADSGRLPTWESVLGPGGIWWAVKQREGALPKAHSFRVGERGFPKGTQGAGDKRRQKGRWAAVLARTHHVATSRKLAEIVMELLTRRL